MDTLNKLADHLGQQALNENQADASKIVLMEERLEIGVQEIAVAKVQINKKVVSENVSQDVEVNEEEVFIERRPVNQYIDTPPEIRYEDNVTIIPVLKEVLVVEKRLVLVEELHITKKSITNKTTVTDTLRKEEVEVLRTALNQDNTISNQ